MWRTAKLFGFASLRVLLPEGQLRSIKSSHAEIVPLADSTKQGTKEGYGVEFAYADPHHGSSGLWRRCVGRAANRIRESNSTFGGGALDDLEECTTEPGEEGGPQSSSAL